MQRKSEDANSLLSEKAKVAEDESTLLNIKLSKADKEIQHLKVEINQVSVRSCLFVKPL